jgi:very-short-patch-repair endonuclease
VLKYNPRLRGQARSLRTKLTVAEQRQCSRLRRKQISGIQFYRQKPIGNYIVDFYAPSVQLVVEVDGSQHLEIAQASYDAERSEYLRQLGLKVLRFDDRQVLMQTDAVVEEIFRTVGEKPLPLSRRAQRQP